MPATISWRGDAGPIAQVTTLTITGAWVNTDFVSATINGQKIEISILASQTEDEIAYALWAAITGTGAAPSELAGDYSRNQNGSDIPEWRELSAVRAVSPGNVITLTHLTPGVTFEVSVAKTAGDTGNIAATTTIDATGPGDLANAANYSGGALPVTGDTLIFDSCKAASSVLYNLDALSAVTLARLSIRNCDREFHLGLPRRNANGYFEYRPAYLEVGFTLIDIDSNSGRIKLNSGSVALTGTVLQTGQARDNTPALLVKGSNASNVWEFLKGSIGVAIYPGETAQAKFRTSYKTNQAGDVDLQLGEGVTVVTPFDMAGGKVTLSSNVTTLEKSGGELIANGAAAVATLKNWAGRVEWNSTGALGGTLVEVGGTGVLDFTRDMDAKTVSTTIQAHKGAKILDTNSVVASLAVKAVGCKQSDIEVDPGYNATATYS